MSNLIELLETIITENAFIEAVISSPKQKTGTVSKITIKPFLSNGTTAYQFSMFTGQKVTHKNTTPDEMPAEFETYLRSFKQAVLFTSAADYQLFSNDAKPLKILKNKPTKTVKPIDSHNRKKHYIIEEGVYCDFLHKLGVMDSNGTVNKNKYDKFRQINKYLEIIDDSVSALDTTHELKIIDFGSGKAYLTFALYWYFTQKRDLKVKISGLDIKDDVIAHCNALAQELHYDGLSFTKITIKDYENTGSIDIAITLHACDTATDDAIVKALQWDAKLIMLVPCCQHEFFKQINNDVQTPLLKHGILKERVSSLITDAVRGMILEILGYSVEIFEFIDMEHTPKNILIRAKKTGKSHRSARLEYENFKQSWGLTPYLEKCLKEHLSNE